MSQLFKNDSGLSAATQEFLLTMPPLWAMAPQSVQPWIEAFDAQSRAPIGAGEMPRIKREGVVGLLDLKGALVPESPWWSRSTVGLDAWTENLWAAGEDSRISSIVINCDSPGGNVLGGYEAARMVRMVAEVKPVFTFVSGMMCSLAVLVCSGSSMIVAREGTTHGSVGTIMQSTDYSKMMEKMGVVQHNIVSKNAPLKRASLSDPKGRAVIQSVVDEMEDMMIGSIAAGRGITTEKIIKEFGSGGIMGVRAALNCGMIDAIGTFAEVLEMAGGGEVEMLGMDDGE